MSPIFSSDKKGWASRSWERAGKAQNIWVGSGYMKKKTLAELGQDGLTMICLDGLKRSRLYWAVLNMIWPYMGLKRVRLCWAGLLEVKVLLGSNMIPQVGVALLPILDVQKKKKKLHLCINILLLSVTHFLDVFVVFALCDSNRTVIIQCFTAEGGSFARTSINTFWL